MKKYSVTMGCTSCKWKIEGALKNVGIEEFEVNKESHSVTIYHDEDIKKAKRAIEDIGYLAEELDDTDFSDEELLILADQIRNGTL